MLEPNALSNRVICLAIDVHLAIGPGLLETIYQECMCVELADAGIPFQSQAMVPVHYKGRSIPLDFRSDIVVADAIIQEIKEVAAIIPAHEAQLLTNLRMSGIRLGFLMSFHAPKLKD